METQGEWAALPPDGAQVRWVSATYLDQMPTCNSEPAEPVASQDQPSLTVTPLSGYGVVTTEKLNVRAGPGVEYEVIGSVAAGDCVDVRGAVEGWYNVSLADNRYGWCSAEYLDRVSQCPVPQVAVAPTQEQVAPPASSAPSYVGQPMATNNATTREAYIHECFGTGNSELRTVSAGTPVQVLGVGAFQPPAEQTVQLGSGPFLKIRLWDGQFAWIPADAVGVDVATVAQMLGLCEEYDRVDWTVVKPPTPTPWPTPTPRWSPPSYSSPSSGCCKICTKGKACGNSCISRSYTCHKGPGCACNG